jgi:hypothetical protein
MQEATRRFGGHHLFLERFIDLSIGIDQAIIQAGVTRVRPSSFHGVDNLRTGIRRGAQTRQT